MKIMLYGGGVLLPLCGMCVHLILTKSQYNKYDDNDDDDDAAMTTMMYPQIGVGVGGCRSYTQNPVIALFAFIDALTAG